MNILVTGAAGFIGSHLVEALLAKGHAVTGVDAFTDYYDPAVKRANLAAARGHAAFRFVEADLPTCDFDVLLDGVESVYHQAGQPGVRASWGARFKVYTENNVLATQKLLEACRNRPLRHFVYASSSSIYGDAESFPTPETALPHPISPYGVTKLAGEHLCGLYHRQFGVPATALRYFTVYGPRQRPDMAFHRFIRAILGGKEITVYGDGRQKRDFTYIADAVAANLAVIERGVAGETLNIGGGGAVSVAETIALLEDITGRKANIFHADAQKGDVRDTAADISRARDRLGFNPQTPLREGLEKEVEWLLR